VTKNKLGMTLREAMHHMMSRGLYRCGASASASVLIPLI